MGHGVSFWECGWATCRGDGENVSHVSEARHGAPKFVEIEMWATRLTVWNETMYYFHLAPHSYRKVFVVLRHMRTEESLASYYVRRFAHLIPTDVEVWEL